MIDMWGYYFFLTYMCGKASSRVRAANVRFEELTYEVNVTN